MPFQQVALNDIILIFPGSRQQRKSTDIHLSDTLIKITVIDFIPSHSTREKDITAYNFLGRRTDLCLHRIVDGVTITMHLIDGIRQWIIGNIYADALIQFTIPGIILHPVFCIIKIGKNKSIFLFYCHNDIRTLLSCCC